MVGIILYRPTYRIVKSGLGCRRSICEIIFSMKFRVFHEYSELDQAKQRNLHPERENNVLKRSASRVGLTTLFAEKLTCSLHGLIHDIANFVGFLITCAVLFPSLRENTIHQINSMSVQEIERAIEALAPEDVRKLAGWLDQYRKKGVSRVNEEALLSEAALAEDWNRPEEDAAWAYLQSAR